MKVAVSNSGPALPTVAGSQRTMQTTLRGKRPGSQKTRLPQWTRWRIRPSISRSNNRPMKMLQFQRNWPWDHFQSKRIFVLSICIHWYMKISSFTAIVLEASRLAGYGPKISRCQSFAKHAELLRIKKMAMKVMMMKSQSSCTQLLVFWKVQWYVWKMRPHHTSINQTSPTAKRASLIRLSLNKSSKHQRSQICMDIKWTLPYIVFIKQAALPIYSWDWRILKEGRRPRRLRKNGMNSLGAWGTDGLSRSIWWRTNRIHLGWTYIHGKNIGAFRRRRVRHPLTLCLLLFLLASKRRN